MVLVAFIVCLNGILPKRALTDGAARQIDKEIKCFYSCLVEIYYNWSTD